MRITKEKRRENHDRIVTIASEMFRERGFDGVSVAELMEKAGMTHGEFYNHFASKEALCGEAARLPNDTRSVLGEGIADLLAALERRPAGPIVTPPSSATRNSKGPPRFGPSGPSVAATSPRP